MLIRATLKRQCRAMYIATFPKAQFKQLTTFKLSKQKPMSGTYKQQFTQAQLFSFNRQ